jgi:hypothetical protein
LFLILLIRFHLFSDPSGAHFAVLFIDSIASFVILILSFAIIATFYFVVTAGKSLHSDVRQAEQLFRLNFISEGIFHSSVLRTPAKVPLSSRITPE